MSGGRKTAAQWARAGRSYPAWGRPSGAARERLFLCSGGRGKELTMHDRPGAETSQISGAGPEAPTWQI